MNCFPIYSDVKVYQPKKQRIRMDFDIHNLWKKHGITLLGSIALMIWTVVTCCITGTIVRNNTTIDVREQMETEFAERLAQMEQERKAATFLTGDASKEAAIKKDAVLLAKIGQGVIDTYKGAADTEDARKVMICAVCRVYSGGEFASVKSIEDAVQDPNKKWWGSPESYTETVHSVAREVSAIFHNGDPLPCASNMVYASWNGTKIVLRDRWEDNSNANRY